MTPISREAETPDRSCDIRSGVVDPGPGETVGLIFLAGLLSGPGLTLLRLTRLAVCPVWGLFFFVTSSIEPCFRLPSKPSSIYSGAMYRVTSSVHD
jgi:hypothetical protein